MNACAFIDRLWTLICMKISSPNLNKNTNMVKKNKKSPKNVRYKIKIKKSHSPWKPWKCLSVFLPIPANFSFLAPSPRTLPRTQRTPQTPLLEKFSITQNLYEFITVKLSQVTDIPVNFPLSRYSLITWITNQVHEFLFLVCIFCRTGHKFRFRRRSSRIFPDGRYHWLVSWPSLWKRQRVIVRDMRSLRSDLSAGEIIVIWFFVPVFRYARYALFYNWHGWQQLRLSTWFVRQQSSCHERRYKTCPHIQWHCAWWHGTKFSKLVNWQT